jgi:hypothetical protein
MFPMFICTKEREQKGVLQCMGEGREFLAMRIVSSILFTEQGVNTLGS